MTLIVISLLFLAFNLVWVKYIPDIRWDASQQKIHTLSLPARQLLATLESPIDLYYFNSRNDPRRSQVLNRYGERVEDLLKQYEKAAKGMLNLHIIDPPPYSEDAYKAGCTALTTNRVFSDSSPPARASALSVSIHSALSTRHCLNMRSAT